MPERTSYAHRRPFLGRRLLSPDVDASVAFYCGLFGWEHTVAENPEETGGYGMFTMGGKLVAGIGPQPRAAAGVEHVHQTSTTRTMSSRRRRTPADR